jgi:pimeloyl-ACP methyl ester carboxylesterase
MAGAVALTAATLDPGLAAGVVLLDTVLFPDPLQRQARETLLTALEGPHWLEALRGFVGARMFTPFDPPELRARIMEELAAVPPQIPAQMMRDFFSHDVSHEINAGRYPLLFIYSRVPADLARLRELRPDVLIGSVVGSGHYIALVAPEQVNAMLDRFLAILPLAAAA